MLIMGFKFLIREISDPNVNVRLCGENKKQGQREPLKRFALLEVL